MSPSEPASGPTGRATDPELAQNPLPVLRAMGRALAKWHRSEPDPRLTARTDDELAAALGAVETGWAPDHPYDRVSADGLRAALRQRPPATPPVPTHGAPVVAAVFVRNGIAEFAGSDSAGLDPPERDLAIALRSIAETFTGEATVAFLDAYEEAGGRPPAVALLDWYSLLAAFR